MDVAPHIRGRVRIQRITRPVRRSTWAPISIGGWPVATFTIGATRPDPTFTRYIVEVINEATGEVVSRDDGLADLPTAIDDCRERVEVYRGAWRYDIRRRDHRDAS